MVNIILFLIAGVVAYLMISYFGVLTNGKNNSLKEVVFSNFLLLPFLFMFIGNIFWSVSIYFGFKSFNFVIPALIAVGVLTSFVFSILVLNKQPNYLNFIGIILIIFGIYFLS